MHEKYRRWIIKCIHILKLFSQKYHEDIWNNIDCFNNSFEQ